MALRTRVEPLCTARCRWGITFCVSAIARMVSSERSLGFDEVKRILSTPVSPTLRSSSAKRGSP